MKQLLELAEKIQNKELRKKVIDFIKDPTPTHKDFKKYPKGKWDEIKTWFSVGGSPVERDVLNHTSAVTELCISIADIVERNYKTTVNKDFLIAGALLHDVMKLVEWKMGELGPEHTGIMLDHSIMGSAELYSREFPEEIIHIVASHFGEHGPTAPRTIEAYIVYNVDSFLAMIEYNINLPKQKAQQLPMILFDDETIKKLGEKS